MARGVSVVAWLGRSWGGRVVLGSGVLLGLVSGCPGDDAPAGSGTGGDEDMPDGDDPGPKGAGCVERIAVPPGFWANEGAAAAQPGIVERVVEFTGDDEPEDETSAESVPGARASSLATSGRPAGATTQDPHIHERWSEARKLELSYCINGMPGEDAENLASYHKTIRALNSTMAEWERVSGANFVHVREDDTPELETFVILQGNQLLARADCVPGTKAYFGVVSLLEVPQGVTNAVPQAWDDPTLEPIGGNLARTILLQSSPISDFGDQQLLTVLRHELGHVMGFVHEEVNHPGSVGGGCSDVDPRPLTPVDPSSIMSTPGCTCLSDSAAHLTHFDRLSAFYLHHTPRSRFETRSSSAGYRYSGAAGDGAEILWHAQGATEGVLWLPQAGPGGITFASEPFPYSSLDAPPAGGWFSNESEVVIPVELTGNSSAIDIMMLGPGPNVDDFVVFNSGGATSVVPWLHDSFSVPVVGRFDGQELGRDIVYLYRPGAFEDTAVSGMGGVVVEQAIPPQQSGFAFPLAAPYRGLGHPDDIVWLEPHEGRVTAWLIEDNAFALAHASRRPQAELGLVPGENIPVVGDFNGDNRADIMWQGVSNLPAGFLDIEDVLWLSTSTATELAFSVMPKSVGHSFRPFVGDFDGDGIDDIFWHRSWGLTSDGPTDSTTGPSFIWYHDQAGGHEARAFALDADFSPYVGDFDADGCHDIVWFDMVGEQAHVWRCIPGARDFECGESQPTPPGHAPVGVHWGF